MSCIDECTWGLLTPVYIHCTTDTNVKIKDEIYTQLCGVLVAHIHILPNTLPVQI